MSGVWISDGVIDQKKIPFTQTLTYIKNFCCKWSFR